MITIDYLYIDWQALYPIALAIVGIVAIIKLNKTKGDK